MKNMYFITLSIIVIVYILHSIRKNKLSVKNSFGWFFLCIVMLILSIFPKSLDWLAISIGISYPPALFLTLCVVVLLVIDFSYSKKIEDLHKKVVDLAQELSIVRANQNEKDKH